ncbi:lysophospholipase [Nocardia vinacea]|uniref:Lysophospholipase n=1 Tax=Nocardia vinacea TaxID=96468 RepID=A0ABZ1YXT6_9NOCA|nr:alpha/beta fold hydrolase [Nocardia vinacea]
MKTEQSTFTVDGISVDAVLTLPDTTQELPVPAVFTGPGFAGVKEMLIPDYSRDLAERGIASLAFDYPGFGGSAGDPRQQIDPPQQLRTFRGALDALCADSRIDNARIGVWGTSMSGGHSLVMAATDSRVKAVAAIIPFIHLTPAGNTRLLSVLARDAIRRATGRPGLTIPVAGHPGEVAAMNSDGAYEWAEEMAKGASAYRNVVTVASLPRMLKWSTADAANKISIPVLAILAETDTITPPARVRKALEDVPNVDYLSYPESHFELFTVHGASVRDDTVEWLSKQLL